jgi:hypothetical protein
VHPDVIAAYMDGSLLHLRMRATPSPRRATQTEGLRAEERAVLRLLEKLARDSKTHVRRKG